MRGVYSVAVGSFGNVYTGSSDGNVIKLNSGTECDFREDCRCQLHTGEGGLLRICRCSETPTDVIACIVTFAYQIETFCVLERRT